jgi:threonine dehydratase
MTITKNTRDWSAFDSIDIAAAARALEGIVQRTPLAPWASEDARIELRLKLENRQETGAFKARGAVNQIRQLSQAQREAGVVACSSGNHGKALAWAARRAGVPATIVMPHNAYPNKIEACRELGAEIVLSASRRQADVDCERIASEGKTMVHPYDSERTVAGAGTVGLEIAEDWPDVELVILPVGGGGLIAGSSLALRRALGEGVTILGAEPSGAATMQLALEAGEPVDVEEITTEVQGLCPMNAGRTNVAICLQTLDGVVTLSDPQIFDSQAWLVRSDEVVEPAGAAAVAVVRAGLVPAALLEGRSAVNPLRVAAVVSGGNPDPAQYEALRKQA